MGCGSSHDKKPEVYYTILNGDVIDLETDQVFDIINSDNSLEDEYQKYNNNNELSYSNFLLSVILKLYYLTLFHHKRYCEKTRTMFENQNCDRLCKLVEEYFKIPKNITVLSYQYIYIQFLVHLLINTTIQQYLFHHNTIYLDT